MTANTFTSLQGLFKNKPGGKVIKKEGSTYKVTSEKGRNLGSGYKSKEDAKKRLRQVEYFKHLKKSGYLK